MTNYENKTGCGLTGPGLAKRTDADAWYGMWPPAIHPAELALGFLLRDKFPVILVGFAFVLAVSY